MGKGNIPINVSGVDATGRDRELVPDGKKIKTLKFPHGFNAYIIEAIKELKKDSSGKNGHWSLVIRHWEMGIGN